MPQYPMKFFITLISSAFILSACHSSTSFSSNIAPTNNEKPINKLDSTIFFFTFSIKKSNSGNIITLLNTKKTQGKLKPHATFIRNKNTTLIAQLYSNETMLGSTAIEHPLYQTLEGPSNTIGALQTTTKLKDSSGFFLRVQYTQPITSIHFIEKINDKENTLNTINL